MSIVKGSSSLENREETKGDEKAPMQSRDFGRSQRGRTHEDELLHMYKPGAECCGRRWR